MKGSNRPECGMPMCAPPPRGPLRASVCGLGRQLFGNEIGTADVS